MRQFQLFRVAGVANSTTYDGGLKSTTAEPKRLIAVHLEMSAYAATDDNNVQLWHEQVLVSEFPEKSFRTELAAATASTNVAGKRMEIPVDLNIPSGEIARIAIKCGATLTSIRGAYEYEVITA
jgi:hypothetical protein